MKNLISINPTVSAEQLQNWKKQRENTNLEIRRLYVEINNHMADVQALDSLISGAQRFMPLLTPIEDFSKTNSTIQLKPEAEKKFSAGRRVGWRGAKTWSAIMFEILKKENRGMSYKEVKNELIKTSIAPRLENSDKAFYNAIPKLVGDGLIVKHNGRLYSIEAFKTFQEYVEAGIEIDSPFGRKGRHSLLGEEVKKLLTLKNEGLNTKQIKKVMLEDERFCEQIKKHHSYLYNVLANLERKKEVKKEGKVYFVNK